MEQITPPQSRTIKTHLVHLASLCCSSPPGCSHLTGFLLNNNKTCLLIAQRDTSWVRCLKSMSSARQGQGKAGQSSRARHGRAAPTSHWRNGDPISPNKCKGINYIDGMERQQVMRGRDIQHEDTIHGLRIVQTACIQPTHTIPQVHAALESLKTLHATG